MEKTDEMFEWFGTPYTPIVGVVLSLYGAIILGNTHGFLAGIAATLCGLAATFVLTYGLYVFNTKVQCASLKLIFVMATIIGLIGIIGFVTDLLFGTFNHTLSEQFGQISIVVTIAPSILGSIIGLIKHASDQIWIYKHTH